MSYWQVGEEEWEWQSLTEALEAAGLWPMNEYIWRRRDTIAKYIKNSPIYELCTGGDNMPGPSIFMRWWDQEINLEEEGDSAREGGGEGDRMT